MNRLKPDRQKLVLDLLCEGNSIRSIVRLTGVNLRTIIRLVRECGELCEEELDLRMRNLNCKLLQADEIHTICGKKERHVEPKDKGGEFGEMYLFFCLDPVSKIVPCFRVGKRTGDNAYYLIHDLKQRIKGRFQLTTDGFFGYDNCMTLDFMRRVDYAQVIKVFKSKRNGSRETYSPGRYVWLKKSIMCGNPDPKHISTSLIENVNLQIRHYAPDYLPVQ
ncbi:hypothetical protein IIA94_02240 [Patescibacteria group bacterium]|nr:hypothetical protein [Patescibacteria group bacterium]